MKRRGKNLNIFIATNSESLKSQVEWLTEGYNFNFLTIRNIDKKPKPRQLPLEMTIEEEIAQIAVEWSKIVDYCVIAMKSQIRKVEEHIWWLYTFCIARKGKILFSDKTEGKKGVIVKNEKYSQLKLGFGWEEIKYWRFPQYDKMYWELSPREMVEVNGWNLVKDKFQQFLKEGKF